MLHLNNQTPFSTTLLADIQEHSEPCAVCVVKMGFTWVEALADWSATPMPLQMTETWERGPARNASDTVPYKEKSELLLRGEVRSGARVSVEKQGQIVMCLQAGEVAIEPILYWQDYWRLRTAGNSFLVAPKSCRFVEDWQAMDACVLERVLPNQMEQLRFNIPKGSVSGTLKQVGLQETIEFKADTLVMDTDTGNTALLWRARFPWHFLGTSAGMAQGVLSIAWIPSVVDEG